MPKLVSELTSTLSTYVHPDLTFLGVLNEVLPQLATKGIWKDLTFEQSVPMQASDRFFTLPENAQSVLHSLVNNEPTVVRPLWNAFVNAGASSGRSGSAFGVEDAGYISTKEVLDSRYYYALFAFPKRRWDEADDADDGGSRWTVDAFNGDETITIEYENWEGVTVTTVDTLQALATPQPLSACGVRNIRSIRYGNIVVPVTIVAVPIRNFGLLDYASASNPDVTITALSSALNANFNELDALGGSTRKILSLNPNFDTFSTAGVLTVVTSSASTLTGNVTGWTGTDPESDLPVAIFGSTLLTDVLTRGEDYRRVADILPEGGPTGIVRYRLFRIQAPGTNAHLLFRRRVPKFTASSEIVYLDNVSALKYAILANTAEYNNDVVQSRAWWAEAKRVLDEELAEDLGAATPQVRFDPSGGLGGVENLM